MPVSKKEVQNLLEHRDHLTVLAGGTPSERRLVLDDPSDELVRALSTASRVAHDGGELPDTVYEKHNRKLQIAVSRNKALRTKKKLVQSQRGGSFWSEIAKVALPILGGIGGSFLGGPMGGAAGSAAGGLLADQIGAGKRKNK